jgi:hypothetical protein
MTIPTVTGKLDADRGIIVPNDSSTWNSLNSQGITWNNWNQWDFAPANPLVWLANVLDLGSVQDFTLNILTTANGTVSYDVFVSDTGAFGGEESQTTIAATATAVPAFRGRYVLVAINVAITNGLNTLENVEIQASDRTVDIKLSSVNTSTLSGTASARQLVLPRTPSKVVHMQITPEQVTSFNIDAYVTQYPTSTQLIPRIVSRTVPVTIALQGRDGIDRDGICDITLSVLPEQFMDGANLRTR